MISVPRKGLYSTVFNLTVLVTGLGYFIDTFDFFVYNGMRVVSLTELGLSGDALTRTGIIILNCQIFGAVVGSLFWGVLGDRVGRKRALLSSILIYSIGMICTGFVHDTTTYGLIRFLTGFGVAGELGLGATLVAETIQSSHRTFALAFFTVMGLLGVAFAALGVETIGWRASCIGGGVFGLLLLVLRGVLFESRLFEQAAEKKVKRGSLRELFGKDLRKFIFCFLILVPNYFVTGILMTLAPEVGVATGTQGTIKANIALGVYFTVAALGDLLGATLSEFFRSRRLVAGLFILGNIVLAVLFVQKLGLSVTQFYALCAVFGLFNLWAMSATIAVEQFPTRLRATATTASLNFSRGAVILMNLLLLAFRPFGVLNVLLVTGVTVAVLGMVAVWQLPETYGHSLAD